MRRLEIDCLNFNCQRIYVIKVVTLLLIDEVITYTGTASRAVRAFSRMA